MEGGERIEAGRRVGWAAVKAVSWGTTRRDGERTAKLGSAPEVDEVLVVVQSPHALAPRRLQLEHLLELAHDVEVRDKDARNHRLLVGGRENANEAEDEEVGEEGELVTRPVVESRCRAERRAEVVAELGEDGVLLFSEDLLLKVFLVLRRRAC